MTQFDGCQYGLKSARHGMYHFYLKKPWAFATNIPNICDAFATLCKGTSATHKHDITCGINAKHSQFYTPLMAVTIHIAFFDFYMIVLIRQAGVFNCFCAVEIFVVLM